MASSPFVRYVDAAFVAPGLEGDALVGLSGPVFQASPAALPALPARSWVTADFYQVRDNWLKQHAALDLAPTWNGPRALWIGVQNAGRPIWYQLWNGVSGPGGGYGNAVLIEHEDGELSLYAHLARFSDRLGGWIAGGGGAESAPWLEEGDFVGEMGNTGNVWGTRPDGSVGPPAAGDLETGKHLHWERRTRAALGNVLIDPASRMDFVDTLLVDVSSPVQLPAPSPEPNQPLALGPVQARAEAQLMYRLVLDLEAYPIREGGDPYGAAVDALQREAQEIVDAYGSVAPVLEAQNLIGLLDVFEVNPIGYPELIEAVRGQVAELLVEIQNAIP